MKPKSQSKLYILLSILGIVIILITKMDIQTKVFMIVSLHLLSFIHYYLLKLRRFKFIPILLVNVAFGYLLSKITVYHIFVHVSMYFLPGFIPVFFVSKVLPNLNRPTKTKFSFVYKSVKGTRFVLTAVFRSIALIGGAGSGKTVSFIKPTIKQMAQQDFCGVIYDYKKFDLAKCAYTHYLDSNVEYKGINFFSLSHSHQINPISPSVIESPAYATEAAHTFISNLTKASKNSDPWFTEAAESILSGIIWKLKEDAPHFCTLPYATAILLLKKTEEVVDFVSSNKQAEILASAYIKICVSEKQASAVEGTLANALRKIALPEIFWVLSGDDINFNLNDKQNPTLLCLSNYMKLDATYAPIIALIIDMCAKSMAEPGRQQAGFIIEEGSTIYLPNLAKIPATLREYMVFVMFCIQDITQGEILYDKLGLRSLLANLGTHIYGRVMDMETAERYAKMYGRFFKTFTSKTRRSSGITAQSYTESERQVFLKEPEEFMHLKPGHFFGLLAEGNKRKFDDRFEQYQDEEFDLPIIREVTTEMVKDNFEKIINDVKTIF